MEHGVPEDEVERRVGEGELRGVGADGIDLDPESPGRRRELVEHPPRDVGGHRGLDHAGAEQVQREVAGPRADLEGPPEAQAALAERALQLGDDLGASLHAVRDPPFAVVVRGGDVVVAGVDVLDLLGGRSRHLARVYPRPPAWLRRRRTRSRISLRGFRRCL